MTAVLAPPAFRVAGPLPTGTTVLEASAGTGKTYTIAALAARYVAEGVATLPELMLVTFGREATTELRERVRSRLVETHRALADPDAARTGSDPVAALLADAGHDEVSDRRERLRQALATFDAATIATTHEFCRQMLDGLGVAADADLGATFVESVEDLTDEVVADFYIRKYGRPGAGDPDFTPAVARQLAREAVGDQQAVLEPRSAPPGSPAHVRRSFADAVRKEVARRMRVRRLYSYDDMLTRLDASLSNPDGTAARRLRSRYRVVLVDEFQDTDPVQWRILRTAFHGHTTLVLIGDPKQAIYAFRGADVASYLEARNEADHHSTLVTNFRSDGPLIDALDTLFAGAALGHPDIVVHPVGAHHGGARLSGAPVDTPVRLRVVPRDGLVTTGRNLVMKPGAMARVAGDCAADVAALLASPARLSGRRARAGDVAVLVRTNDQAATIRAALAAVGVPAVQSGTASVFGTPIAGEWLTLLEALEAPRAMRMRAAALTCFLGADVAGLCGPDGEALLERLGGLVREWSHVLRERGVAALLEAVTTGTGVPLPQRLLTAADGERRLTDLRHVGQALHEAAVDGHLGPAALVDWLRRRIAEAHRDVGADRSRRLESDAAAVQIITVHRSKGLEFPVVYLPFAWDRWLPDEPQVALLHDEEGRRVLDVGGSGGDGWPERVERWKAEELGEDLRLLYVALTRARSQVVAWWVPGTTTASSPLHRVLFGRPAVGGRHGGSGFGGDASLPASCKVPTDSEALDALRTLPGPGIAVEAVGPRPVATVVPVDAPPTGLEAARFDRTVDTTWRRTSYTALTAAAGHHGPGASAEPGVASEPEEPGTDDEGGPLPEDGGPLDDVFAPPSGPGGVGAGADGAAGSGGAAAGPGGGAVARAAAVPSPMADLPVGAAFGTLVHSVFETADLTVPDLHGELAAHAAEQIAHRPVGDVDADTLATGLLPCARTPLGPIADHLRLADIAPGDQLAELDFELPLAGGDRAGGGPAPTLGALAPLLAAHLPADDPLAHYPELLRAPELAGQPLRGYLTGSIDAVLRVPGATGDRFVIADYKTNWLGPVGADGPEPLTAAHYTPARMAEAMADAHYPLQALLYGVALHRYLRWRLPGYDPDTHLGGVLYLFVRGMCGPDTPVVDGWPCGVFGWSPPPSLTVALSAFLAGGER